MNSYEKKIRLLLIFRILLWLIALSATIYWVNWSFKLYTMDILLDVSTYADNFRPKFAVGLLISLVAIGISFILRHYSDSLKIAERESWKERT